jgi:beta-mannosidase
MVISQKISLNGSDWQFKEYYGEDWRWRNAHKADTRDVRHWRTGTVPGSVHNDLWNNGEIPNPYFERNSLLLEWIPARTWLYKKIFTVDAAHRGKRVQLCFEGVDYEAEFFLNGVSLGTHRGMYTPATFDVTDILQYGAENTLAVVIEAAPHEQPQVSRTSKVRTHKSRMTYWWDFCPRMIHVGIWDEVYLNITGEVRIDNVWVRATPTDDHATVAVFVEVHATRSTEANFAVFVLLDEQEVATRTITIALEEGKNTATTVLRIDSPHLWYPNGLGTQPMYQAIVRVDTPDGEDTHTTQFGIRIVELIPNETDDVSALPYTLVVNGKKVYIKGWNWVPLDVMCGVPNDAKLMHLLTLAKNANVNLLRIWGGGLIEREAFYRLCDALGIMVWQEFIQSSSGIENYAPDDSETIAMMVREAEQIIPRKRNHPSLVLWCGGNELSGEGTVPLDDSHPMLSALKGVVNRLDPDRFWLPTSPSGRVFGNTLENIKADPSGLHDVHGPWEFQGVDKHYTLYNAGTSLLHSEFGVEGVTNLNTLNATIHPDNQLPATLDNRVWHHLGAWWIHQPTWRATFGEITEIEPLVRATQTMQAEGLRYALEADRRRMFRNSGTLPWQFNEPYPMAACTSAVDYYGQPKPVYYAVARTYVPISITAKFPTSAWSGRDHFTAELWGVTDHPNGEPIHADLNMAIIGIDGMHYADQRFAVNIEHNRAARLGDVNVPLESIHSDVFFLELQLRGDNQVIARNRYFFTKTENWAVLRELPPATLNVEENGDQITITNTGEVVAFGVWLEDPRPVGSPGYVQFEDNHFTLMPNEARTVVITWLDAPDDQQDSRIRVSAWNYHATI